MPEITEKIQLLGKGLYTSIPDELTLTSIPTSSELDYVGGEDFDKVMLEKIFPKAIVEDINYGELLQIDYQWICRCLRIINYGPYFTTNAIICDNCGERSIGEYQVDLNTVECKMLPEGFKNEFTLDGSSFINYKGTIKFKLPTISEVIASYNDKTFKNEDGTINKQLARICYMITSIDNNSNLSPIEIRAKLLKNLTSADYIILRNEIEDKCDYGLRAGGTCQCPKCKQMTGAYLALVDDRFFRPTMGDLRKWRDSRSTRED